MIFSEEGVPDLNKVNQLHFKMNFIITFYYRQIAQSLQIQEMDILLVKT